MKTDQTIEAFNNSMEKERVYNVKLPVFEGPFDLLLHLIKEHEIDIYDIPIVQITKQYLGYIDLMKELNLDIAGEFLVIAATLTHIKSKMLLPKADPPMEDEGEDPREELISKLVEYKGFKDVTGFFRNQEELREEIFPAQPDRSLSEDNEEPLVDLDVFALLGAFKSILKNIGESDSYEVEFGDIPVTEKLNSIMDALSRSPQISFNQLFYGARKRREVVATFLALLELVRLKLVCARQKSRVEPIVIIKSVESDGIDGQDKSNH